MDLWTVNLSKTFEGRPLLGRKGHTSVYMVPDTPRSPVSAVLSCHPWQWYGTRMLIPSSGGARVVRSVVPCQSSTQGSGVTGLATPEASLKRLVPLADFLTVCKRLPNVSQCVLKTVERGYRIQFCSCLPRFNGVVPH